MINEERRVMIIPIGLELERAIVGISEYSPDMVYVIYSKKDGENVEDKIGAESERFKEIFINKIRGLWKCKEFGIDVTNLSKCTNLLKDIILGELEESKNTFFYINISTSSKIFSFSSFYLAGKYLERILLFYVKPTHYLMVDFVDIFQEIVSLLKNRDKIEKEKIDQADEIIKRYKNHGWTDGPFEVIEIPYYKLSKYPKYEINVLKIMNIHKNDYPKGFTIEDLLKLKNEEIDERSNKIKLNHYLTELEKHSLIESNPINRKKYVKIQKSGEIFLKTIASLIEN